VGWGSQGHRRGKEVGENVNSWERREEERHERWNEERLQGRRKKGPGAEGNDGSREFKGILRRDRRATGAGAADVKQLQWRRRARPSLSKPGKIYYREERKDRKVESERLEETE